MRSNLGIGFIFTAKDVASTQIQRLGRNFEAFERKTSKILSRVQVGMRQFAVGVGIMVAGGAGLAGSLQLADEAGQFEMGMAKVAAISNIATDSVEASKLEVKALDAAMKTQFSPTEAAEGLENFASQGFGVQEQMEALTPALRLAQSGMIPVADAADAMTSALKVFGLEADQSALVTDKLLKISNLTSLQAKDLSLALGTVSRGASATGQSIDEMLVSMGLVKNTGVDASVAASSVSSALLFMGKESGRFKDELGVSVTDASGNFRDFIDIVMETDKALGEKYTDSAERAAMATKLFGRFGLTAFQAVSSQVNHGVKDMEGNLLQGADAVDYLRTQLAGAAGTAEVFEDKLLSTYEGQKKLLEGVMQTVRTVLGQPLAAVFKPIVTGIRDGVEKVIGFIMAIPEDTRNLIAKIAVGFFSLVTALGALLALRGGIALISASMSFLGITAASVVTPLLIIVGVLALAGLAFAAFRADAKHAGEAGRPLINAWTKVKLFFQGLVQYIKDGELSGAILDELNKAENEGVKDFLGNILDFGARLQKFFEGAQEGFGTFIEEAQPAFDEFKVAMRGLGDSMGFFTEDIDRATGTPMAQAKSRGVDFGIALAKVAVLLVQALTMVVKIVGAVLTVLDDMGLSIGDAVKLWIAWNVASKGASIAAGLAGVQFTGLARGGLSLVAMGLRALPALFSLVSTMAMIAWVKMGPIIAALAGPAGLVIAAAAAGAAIGMLLNRFGAADKLTDFLGDITGLNKELAKLDEINGGRTETRGFGGDNPFQAGRSARLAAEQGLSVEEYQQKRLEELRAEGYDAQINPETGDVELKGGSSKPSSSSSASTPAAAMSAEVAPAGSMSGPDLAELAVLMVEQQRQVDDVLKQLDRNSKRPLVAELKINEETIASAVQRGDQANRSRAFAPLPAEGG